jgi:hypothetical protein
MWPEQCLELILYIRQGRRNLLVIVSVHERSLSVAPAQNPAYIKLSFQRTHSLQSPDGVNSQTLYLTQEHRRFKQMVY